MYKALLFDMDGTILDTEKIYFEHFSEGFQKQNRELTKEAFKAQVGVSEEEGAEIMTERFFPDLSPEDYINIIDKAAIKEKFKSGHIDIMPGFNEIVDRFKGRLVYAIATGSSTELLLSFSERFGFHKDFVELVSRDEVPQGKPAPDIYLLTADRLGVDISECIVLEDSPAGVQSGKNAGAYTIAVRNEWTHDMDFTGADYICDSLFEAMEHIEKIMQ